MSSEKEESEKIPSHLSSLKDISGYKTINITEDYTITERQIIKYWSDRARETNENESRATNQRDTGTS